MYSSMFSSVFALKPAPDLGFGPSTTVAWCVTDFRGVRGSPCGLLVVGCQAGFRPTVDLAAGTLKSALAARPRSCRSCPENRFLVPTSPRRGTHRPKLQQAGACLAANDETCIFLVAACDGLEQRGRPIERPQERQGQQQSRR